MTASIFCGSCGAENSADAVFCTNCGAVIRTASESPAPATRPTTVAPTASQPRRQNSVKTLAALSVVLLVAIVAFVGLPLLNRDGRSETDELGPQSTDQALDASSITTTTSTTTTSTTTTSSTTATTTTTTTPQAQESGVAPPEFWIDGVQMALPVCDGSFITIIASTSGSRAASSSRDYYDGNYLRTDITCDSLNPFFSSGSLQGQPIYLVFFGPYYDRYEAQQKCLDLGIRKKSNCYVAPLTPDSGDRSVRFGPLDP